LAGQKRKYPAHRELIPESIHDTSQYANIRAELSHQPNCLVANRDSTLGKQIFDISMTQVKAMIEPYSILNNFRWKSVTFLHCG
jgi:hypothetical protein